MEAAQARLASLDYQLCPHCDAPAGRDFLRCPHCLHKLRDTCATCSRPLDPDWMICPYCESEIPGVTPQRRSRRRRGESAAARELEDDVYGEDTAGGYEQDTAALYGETAESPYGQDPGFPETGQAAIEDTIVSQAPPSYDEALPAGDAGTSSEPPPGYGQPRQ